MTSSNITDMRKTKLVSVPIKNEIKNENILVFDLIGDTNICHLAALNKCDKNNKRPLIKI